MDPEGALAVEEIPVQSEALTDGNGIQTISNTICPNSTSLDVHVSQAEHESKEDMAATVIQSAFRAFLVCYVFKTLCYLLI